MASDYAEVARTLATSSAPMIVVDAIDLAGAAAVVDLARSLRATIALAHPSETEVQQQHGLLTISTAEARQLCKRLVVIGNCDGASQGGLEQLLKAPGLMKILHIDTGAEGDVPKFSGDTSVVKVSPDDLADALGAIKVHAADGIIRPGSPGADIASKTSNFFAGEGFGIIAYEAGSLPRYAMFAAMALADSLSKKARWSLVSLGGAPGQAEMVRMSLSLTGLPPPLSFRQGRLYHDHVTLQPQRLIDDGDVDTVIWISASNRQRPDWLSSAKNVIAIDASDGADLALGTAGTDYAAIVEPDGVKGFSAMTPETGSPKSSAVAVLTELRTAVEDVLPKSAMSSGQAAHQGAGA